MREGASEGSREGGREDLGSAGIALLGDALIVAAFGILDRIDPRLQLLRILLIEG